MDRSSAKLRQASSFFASEPHSGPIRGNVRTPSIDNERTSREAAWAPDHGRPHLRRSWHACRSEKKIRLEREGENAQGIFGTHESQRCSTIGAGHPRMTGPRIAGAHAGDQWSAISSRSGRRLRRREGTGAGRPSQHGDQLMGHTVAGTPLLVARERLVRLPPLEHDDLRGVTLVDPGGHAHGALDEILGLSK